VEQKFVELLGLLQFDDEVLEWVRCSIRTIRQAPHCELASIDRHPFRTIGVYQKLSMPHRGYIE